MPPTVSIAPQPVETIVERSKKLSERMDRPGYQDLQSKCVQDGLSEGGNSKSSSTLHGKAEPRFLENSMSGSRQDTSGAAEGPFAEHNSGHRVATEMDGTVVDKRGSPFIPTPKTVGTCIMRGRALRTEDFKIDGFPRSHLKSRGTGTKSRTGVQSPLLSFRSLLEGAISASGVQPPTPVQGIAESGRQCEPSVGDSVPRVSYSSLLQAQLGNDPVEIRADPSCKTAGTLHLNVEAHSTPVKLQLQSAEVEGGFLALLNQTTRLLALVAQRPSSPRADSVSTGGRISGVHFSDKLLQAVSGDTSRSADIVSERDGSDSLRAITVPASAVLTRSEDDVPRVEVVVERRSSLEAGSMCSDEDALGTPLPEEGDGPLAINESRSTDIPSERVAIDFSEKAAVPGSPVLTRIEEDVSPADVVVVRESFVVADSVSTEDDMADFQLFEELSRALAIDESRFPENESNVGAIDSPEAAAALTSPVPTRTEQGVLREEVVVERSTVVVADSVSTDEKASDVQLSEEPSGILGVEEIRLAHNVPKRDVIDSSEASAVPEIPVFTRLEEADLPAGVERASCAVADSISGEENASDVQPPERLLQELAVDESRSAEIVSERDAVDSSGAAAVPTSPVLVRREEKVPRVEVVVAGLMGNDEKMSEVFVSDEPSQALALDELRNTDIMIEGDAANLSEAAEPVPIRTREDVPLSEASVKKEVGLCGDAVVHSEQGKGHLLSFNRANGQMLDERIQSSSQRLETEKRCADGRDGLIDAGTTLVSSCQAGLKQMGDADADSVDAEMIFEWSCKDGVKKMMGANGGVVGLREDNLCEVQRNFVLDSVSETDETFPSGCRSGLIAAGAVVECPCHAVPKQTENQNALFVEERKDEMCDAHMPSSTGNVPLKSKADIDLSKFVLEKELDISKGGPIDSLHTEVVKRAEENVSRAEAVVERRSSLVDSMCTSEETLDAQFPEEDDDALPVDEPRSADLLSERVAMVSREVAAVPASHIPTSIEEDVSPAKVVVDPVSVLVADSVSTDEQMSEAQLFEELTGALGGSISLCGEPEVEQHKVDNFADGMPEVQRAILPYSESRAGFVASGTGYESVKLSPSESLVVEPGILNEEERVPGGYVGEIVHVATDSGNSGVRADQGLRSDPDALSEGLRQACLRESDATVSGSLESVQVSGAEIGVAQEAGKEVQSPLVKKSKDRHSRHVDDLEDRHTSHADDLKVRRTRHLDELEDNGKQPYASPLNGTVHDQLVGAEVRPLKKRGRPRTYNHDKALHETGRPHPKRKRLLQNTSNRCRRNRHMNQDQPVPVLVEGRDEGFEDADGGALCRWLAHQDEGNAAPSPAVRKKVRKPVQQLVKPMIATPSFRVVPEYEDSQQKVEKRRKVVMQQHPGTRETLMSSSTVRASDYDMDDEDERWLHAWNKQLARGGLKQPISEDKFEEMIEYFERMYAQMEVAPAGDFPGFPDRQKSLAHSVPGSSLPSTSLSGLGCISTNPATPVPENAPALNPPRITSGHPPWTAGLKDVSSSGKQVVVSAAIRVDSIGGESASPASTVLFHTLTSENERNICKSVVDTVTEKPSEGSLQKSFEPHTQQKPSDDCCICNGGEDDENNPVYTCKRCLIHVHQSCYGIREKFRDDEGQVVAPSSWCCRKCEAVAVGRAQPTISCALCRKSGGALKPTVAPRKWAHVACALYTNETFFVDPDAMEPIDGIAAVAARAQDRQDRCGLCGVKRGVCSLCSVKDCRAPFHISCGVSQGASFELRQSKQKVVRVRSFCPRHAHTTPTNSAPSAGVKQGHVVSSSTTATASATASGSISTALSMDDRDGGSSKQSISCPDGSFVEPARVAGRHIADLTDNVMRLNGNGVESAGRDRPKGIHFTLKRRWDESCTQVSDDGLLSDFQKKSGHGRGVTGDKMEAPGCKSTWHVVEPRQKLKKIKFKFGRLAQNQDPESSPTLVQEERISTKDSEAEKIKEVMPAIGEASGEAAGNDRDTVFLNGLSEDRFAKEVKELTILEQATKSGVAPVHIMREAFVYWRAKRAEYKGSLLCELHHKQWSKSQGIFKIPGDPRDVGKLDTGKRASPIRVPLAQQLSSVSTEKMLEKAKELREQLDRVRSIAQVVVQREKLKYNQRLVLMTIASAELNRDEGISEERRCVWCPSTRTLLKCGTCPRSFCFNCFKNRKGFGVKGWMAAMKHPLYSCIYCQELSIKVADLSNNLDPAPKEIVNAGLVSNPVVPSEPVDGMVSTSMITSDPVGEGRGKGIGKGRGKGWGLQGFDNPDPASLRRAEGEVTPPANKILDVNEVRSKVLGIGRGKGNGWRVSDNAGPSSSRPGSVRRGSENGANKQSKPSQLEAGLNKFFSIANDQMKHSSFETTLRRLKILRRTNTHANKELTVSAEIPSGDIAEETADVRASGPVNDGFKRSTTNGGKASVLRSPVSGPALLVYKKNRRLILGASSESPPSAYDFADELNYPPSPTGLENRTPESPVGLSPSG